MEDELHVGDPVVVERVQGLVLTVRRAEEWEIDP
jgi:membrane protein implicated in regulation of membrane protease activity